MKRCLIVCLSVVIASTVALAQDTAYKALRVIGTQRGEKALGQILSISGKSGRPEPMEWTVKLDDPAARGGVRELNIANGQITADRAPAKSGFPAGRPIELTNLNLDSDGAFRVAEEEARRNQVGFDSVNYSLSSDPASGKPVWTLGLFDYDQQPVGAVRVAAENGKLVSGENWVSNTASQHYAQQHAPPPERRMDSPSHQSPGSQDSRTPGIPPPADYRDPKYQDNAGSRSSDYSGNDSGNYSSNDSGNYAGNDSGNYASNGNYAGETLSERAHRYGATVVDFGEKVLNKTERVGRRIGGWFQKRFTGRDTISPPDEPDQDDEDDSSAARYNRPIEPTRPDGRPAEPAPPE
jgi:hypothetical protein